MRFSGGVWDQLVAVPPNVNQFYYDTAGGNSGWQAARVDLTGWSRPGINTVNATLVDYLPPNHLLVSGDGTTAGDSAYADIEAALDDLESAGFSLGEIYVYYDEDLNLVRTISDFAAATAIWRAVGGLSLGPEQNDFADAAARDAYAVANAAWLNQYNLDRGFWIKTGVMIQRRNAAGDDWEDVTQAIIGGPGGMGERGLRGLPGVTGAVNYHAVPNSGVGGTANGITLTTGLDLTELPHGAQFFFTPSVANTGAVTVNVDTIGNRMLRLSDKGAGSAALQGGDLSTSSPIIIAYDDARNRFVLVAYALGSASRVDVGIEENNVPLLGVGGRLAADLLPLDLQAGITILSGATAPLAAQGDDDDWYLRANGEFSQKVAGVWVRRATLAPLNSPAFAGLPTVPTAAAGTNSTQVASTAYVVAALAAAMLTGGTDGVLSTVTFDDATDELVFTLSNNTVFRTSIGDLLTGFVQTVNGEEGISAVENAVGVVTVTILDGGINYDKLSADAITQLRAGLATLAGADFTGPVGGVDPTAGTHFIPRAYADARYRMAGAADVGDITAVVTAVNSGLAGGSQDGEADIRLHIHNLPAMTGLAIADNDRFALANESAGGDATQFVEADAVREYMQEELPAENIDSGDAAAGTVLTADGAQGSSYQPSTGGGGGGGAVVKTSTEVTKITFAEGVVGSIPITADNLNIAVDTGLAVPAGTKTFHVNYGATGTTATSGIDLPWYTVPIEEWDRLDPVDVGDAPTQGNARFTRGWAGR